MMAWLCVDVFGGDDSGITWSNKTIAVSVMSRSVYIDVPWQQSHQVDTLLHQHARLARGGKGLYYR